MAKRKPDTTFCNDPPITRDITPAVIGGSQVAVSRQAALNHFCYMEEDERAMQAYRGIPCCRCDQLSRPMIYANKNISYELDKDKRSLPAVYCIPCATKRFIGGIFYAREN